LIRRYPLDAGLNRLVIPCTRAAIEISRRRYERAILLLEPTRDFDLGSTIEFYSLYLRGLATSEISSPTLPSANSRKSSSIAV
jgi:hypothetical protein